ncbi:MAG TPA: alkaline phosphatase family protein [Candidatus Binatia bacterium]|jgi:hypothetical protein|nr:alkaline phosphatase family protein [Candidatus Binatia bacterium]
MRVAAAILAVWLPVQGLAGTLPPIQTVFIILMENESWSNIQGNASAPFINDTLLPMASYCQQYYNPPGVHPSLPNYLWLEAGTNFGIFDDNDPSLDHQNTTNHLVTLLNNAGISWRAYQESIGGTDVPLVDTNGYGVRHDPFVYFDDVTGTNNPSFAYGIAHIRPYSELAADLTNNTVVQYNFITPIDCDNMHDDCPPTYNAIAQGDTWLASEVPKILDSAAYQNGGVLFITWDEGLGSDGPIGMIVLSPLARGGGYFNNVYYTHSSTLRTVQEIFGVTPMLGDAANATDLSDLFPQYGFSRLVPLPGVGLQLTAVAVVPGRTNVVQASGDLANWTSLLINSVATNTFTFIDRGATNFNRRFYRLVQLP